MIHEVIYNFGDSSVCVRPGFGIALELINKLVAVALQNAIPSKPLTAEVVSSVRDIFRGTGKEIESNEVKLFLQAACSVNKIHVNAKSKNGTVCFTMYFMDRKKSFVSLQVILIFEKMPERAIQIIGGTFIPVKDNEFIDPADIDKAFQAAFGEATEKT